MNRNLLPAWIACLLLAACAPIPPATAGLASGLPKRGETVATQLAMPADEGEQGEAGRITPEVLMQATYSGIYDEPITLNAGRFQGEPVGGDSARPVVQLLEGTELYGDMDGDGVEDAVVFLLERSGGSGSFTYVASQLGRNGRPADAGAIRIEDRIQVKSATIEDGQVVLEIIAQGPGDAACCGRHKRRKTYALEQGLLTETSNEAASPEMIAKGELDNTVWTLLELNDAQPSLQNASVTITFRDGEMAGSGGCNGYTADFIPHEVNPFVVSTGHVASTVRSCPEPVASQETAYFAALERVSQWSYVYGRLALYYRSSNGEQGRLLFDRETVKGP